LFDRTSGGIRRSADDFRVGCSTLRSLQSIDRRAMLDKRNVPEVVRFGPFTLDGRTGELRNGQIRLKIPDQSISILQALLETPGELVTRDALRDRLWGPETFVDFEAGLNAAVRRLREALNDSADTPRYVETLHRRGYRFIAPVDVVATGQPAATSGTAPADASATVPAEPVEGRRRSVRSDLLALVALALLGSALWFGLRRDNAAPAASAVRPIPITRFPGLEVEPAMSPQGNLVAFAWNGENEDNFDIYVRSFDGTSQRQLTSDAAPDHAPAWSPDGLRIAFIRVVAGRRMIMEVPALGGTEVKLLDAGSEGGAAEGGGWSLGGWSYGLSWTPDGGHLVFGDRNSSITSAIYLYSLKDGQRRRLTSPPVNLSDIHPVVSPDGRYLAFVRLNPQSRGGHVFLQRLEQLQPSGQPTQLTSGHSVTAFDWAHDNRSILHDAGLVDTGLWRVSVAGGASTLVWANVRTRTPSLARSGAGVVYQATAFDSNIYELRLPSSPNSQASRDESIRVIASTANDGDLRLSPDGTRIAFVSARTGHSDLWVSNRDGSQARQLTNFGGWRAGSPCWRADGTSIVFDALESSGHWSLHVVSADGNPISKPLLSDRHNNHRPAWSLDGKWIYFSSDRTGGYEIWRMPSSGGGTLERITWNGGLDPIISPDGRHLYYAKQVGVPGIWEVPLEGGPEVRIVDRGRSLAFDVADAGIFILDASAKPQATVEMFSFASRELVTVTRLPAGLRIPGGSWLNVTPDGRSMLYVRFDQWMADIEMLPGIR
jgi:Tol biopolymer transport system component/DNA-binding winged helix-turn-helix (wHTH) protein